MAVKFTISSDHIEYQKKVKMRTGNLVFPDIAKKMKPVAFLVIVGHVII